VSPSHVHRNKKAYQIVGRDGLATIARRRSWMSTRTLLEVEVQMLVMTKQDPILCHVLLADQLKLLGIGVLEDPTQRSARDAALPKSVCIELWVRWAMGIETETPSAVRTTAEGGYFPFGRSLQRVPPLPPLPLVHLSSPPPGEVRMVAFITLIGEGCQ